MLSAVLGLFTQDLAVDLGSSRTRIHLRGSGIICDQPSVAAIQVHLDGRRRVVAVGDRALPMLGRTPDDIHAIQPIRAGVIEDYDVAKALLLGLIQQSFGRAGMVKPRIAVALPHGATHHEQRALRDSCHAAGAREVSLFPRALAAALGADLPTHEPNGHLIVDIGGGTAEISVISLNTIVHSTVLPQGGEAYDQRIIDYIRRHHATEVGRPSAEHLKCILGSALPGSCLGSHTIKGRCLRLGVPRAISIEAQDVHSAISPQVIELADAIQHTTQTIAPELASDIVNNGIIVVGNGAALDGLDDALRQLTDLPVMIAESPGDSVVIGLAKAMEEAEEFHAIAC